MDKVKSQTTTTAKTPARHNHAETALMLEKMRTKRRAEDSGGDNLYVYDKNGVKITL